MWLNTRVIWLTLFKSYIRKNQVKIAEFQELGPLHLLMLILKKTLMPADLMDKPLYLEMNEGCLIGLIKYSMCHDVSSLTIRIPASDTILHAGFGHILNVLLMPTKPGTKHYLLQLFV